MNRRLIAQGSGECRLGCQVLTLLSTQVAELEAQAATEPPSGSEKEGPGQSLEQLEALVQTKDQVSTECVSVSVRELGPPEQTLGTLLFQEIQTLKSQTSGPREAPDATEREETQQKVQVCVVAMGWGDRAWAARPGCGTDLGSL